MAVALPFLEVMRPRRAHAAGPKRFVVFFTPLGSNVVADMHPTGGTETNFTLGREIAPLQGLKADCLFLSGIDNRAAMSRGGDLHCVGMAALLTATRPLDAPDQAGALSGLNKTQMPGEAPILEGCWGSSPSIDQEIASRIGANSRFKSLELGVRSTIDLGSTPFGFLSYSGPAKAMPRENDPQKAFARLFSAPGAGQTANVAIDVALKQRRSVLDFVHGEYQTLCGQISAADRAACDAHFQSIREVERRFALKPVEVSKSCAQPPAPTAVANPMSVDSFATVGQQQMDILALALTCDATRVASLQWSYARSAISAPWINISAGHHVISHSSDPRVGTINTWYGEQLAYLAKKMKGIQEGDRTLLDNSVIYYCAECAFAPSHSFTNMRCVLVGSCGGALRTGRWLKLGGDDQGRLFVSIMNAMGVDASQFGDPKYNKPGPLPGLT
jgi:hypothetical protein